MAEDVGRRPRTGSRSSLNMVPGTNDESSEARIQRLEAQVDGLRKAVRELADALQEELTSVDSRVSAIESRDEDLVRTTVAIGKSVKRQEEKLRRGLGIIADALAALSPPTSDPIREGF